MEVNTRELNPSQIGAVIHSVRQARIIRQEHPEVADKYRLGQTYSLIAKDIGNIEGRAVMTESVCFAIKGFRGGFGFDAFEGMIEESELSQLARDHRVNSRKDFFRKGKGIFSLSEEDKRRASVNGGLSAKRKGAGIYSLTHEQLSQIAKDVNVSRGFVIWKERELKDGYSMYSEKEYGYRLMHSNLYEHKKGPYNGRPNWALITNEINRIYHNGEDIRSVKTVIETIKRFAKKRA